MLLGLRLGGHNPLLLPSIVADAAHRMLLYSVLISFTATHWVLHFAFIQEKRTLFLKAQTYLYPSPSTMLILPVYPTPRYDIGQIGLHHIHPQMFVCNDCKMI